MIETALGQKAAAPATESPSRPIGVFDSGLGGLTVLREIRQILPNEDLVYVADSRYCPYGGRPPDQIRARARTLARFLLETHHAKAIVVACNTATVAAIGTLRAELDVPFVGMEPAVKPAAAATRSGIVGVLATTATLQGDRFAELLGRVAGGAQVINQPCPGLVEQVEAGDLDGPATRALVQRYVEPLLARGADTLVLGCTHYPFLRPLIEQVAGPAVAVVDSGAAVARQTRRVLEATDLPSRLLAPPCHPERSEGSVLRPPAQPRVQTPGSATAVGTIRFITTGSAAAVAPVLRRLWGDDRAVVGEAAL